MASVNKVILVGNLGKDPEIRYLASGDAVCNFSMATSDRYKDKSSGEMKEVTEWHRISFFGRLAEVCSEYLVKGSTAYVEGRIRTRKWTDQSGAEKYSTEIVGERLQMLSPRSPSGDGGQQRPATQNSGRAQQEGGYERERGGRPSRQQGSRPEQAARQQSRGGFDDMDDDIPF